MGLTPQSADGGKQFIADNRFWPPEGALPCLNIRFADLRERQPVSFPRGGRYGQVPGL
jgi:hypothetical protein